MPCKRDSCRVNAPHGNANESRLCKFNMATPFSSLAGLIPRLAPFNASKHGTLVEFSEACSVAERVRPEVDYCNGVVYTAQPVPVGEVWRITVLSTIDKWPLGLVSKWAPCTARVYRL